MDDYKTMSIVELDLSLLQPNPLQPRGLISPESLTDLVNSIREQGILEPIVVAETPAGYQIIAGERRWRAAKILGLIRVPVVVKQTTPQQMLEMSIVENVQREDLNPVREPLNKKYLKKLFSYGKWITAGGLINYLSIQIDNLFIGKIFGTETLGLYDFAFKTANLAFTQITDTISRVAFPLYVKRNKEKKHLQGLFIKNIISVTIPAVLLTIPFLLFPKEILLVLFGEKWLSAAPTLQILSIYGLFRASIGPGGPLFLSVGKPEILTKLSTLNFILLIGLLFPFSKLAGVQGVAMAMTVSYILIFPLYVYQIYRYFRK